MSDSFVSFLRTVAATLMGIAGFGLIAALWLRELTEAAVIDALLGSVYLIVAIGLLGRSRFSLFMAIVIPAAVTIVLFSTQESIEPIHNLRIAMDFVVMVFSIAVLWHVRHHPSV
ncbi:MAG: hypothetical protein ACI9JM_001663 [Halioglobus sp.]|jgi:hypothetical protein